jgi:hypothetical protein
MVKPIKTTQMTNNAGIRPGLLAAGSGSVMTNSTRTRQEMISIACKQVQRAREIE